MLEFGANTYPQFICETEASEITYEKLEVETLMWNLAHMSK